MSFVQASSFLIQPQGGRLTFMKNETMHIFMPTTSHSGTIQGQSCNTSLTLTDVYCYFEACSGKNLNFLCKLVHFQTKKSFVGFWDFFANPK